MHQYQLKCIRTLSVKNELIEKIDQPEFDLLRSIFHEDE